MFSVWPDRYRISEADTDIDFYMAANIHFLYGSNNTHAFVFFSNYDQEMCWAGHFTVSKHTFDISVLHFVVTSQLTDYLGFSY